MSYQITKEAINQQINPPNYDLAWEPITITPIDSYNCYVVWKRNY